MRRGLGEVGAELAEKIFVGDGVGVGVGVRIRIGIGIGIGEGVEFTLEKTGVVDDANSLDVAEVGALETGVEILGIGGIEKGEAGDE